MNKKQSALVKPEVNIYHLLMEIAPEHRDAIEKAFARAFPESFAEERTLANRLAFLGPWRKALRDNAVADLERKEKNSVLFGWEKDKLAAVEDQVERKRAEIMEGHPEGFIK